jgi:hypothetical protein
VEGISSKLVDGLSDERLVSRYRETDVDVDDKVVKK